jgi:transglutaminase-like putative cysteine protease
MDRSRGAAVASAVAAAVALILLLDAGIETLRSSAPMRWWLGPGALAAVVLSVVAWRPGGRLHVRWGWTGAAWWSAGAVLALLTVSAWLPGGSVDGVRLLGHSTTTVLSVASALAVALAGSSIVRVRAVPLWLRAAAGALSAYAVTAFAIGVSRATPFPALLHGGSAWAVLPFWLQGAFLGGLVLLPAALVVSLIRQGLRAVHRESAAGWTRQETVALGLSVLMTFSGVQLPGNPAMPVTRTGTAPSQPSGPPPLVQGAPLALLTLPPPRSKEPTADEVQARYDRLVRLLPEAQGDARLQAIALGADVTKIFTFVRDAIRYEAYSGILRGANGTLAGRAGNSLDRSVLLSEMLSAHGIRTRLARGQLAPADAAVLFARVFEDVNAPAGSVPPGGEPPDSGFWTRVTARARRDYQVVRTALGDSVAGDGQSARDQALRDIREHVWVQVEVSGQWVDLDTSFAKATVGQSFCAAGQVVDRAPAEWYQQVTVRVYGERLEQDALKTERAFEATFQAVDLVDQPIFLVHVPDKDQPGGMGLGVGAGAHSPDRWSPALQIGQDYAVGRALSFADSSGEDGSFFGALGGGSASAFVAEWLEFEVARPDGRRDVTRRSLTDRATAAWRASSSHDPAGLKPLARDQAGLVAPRAVRNIWFSAGPHNLRGYVESIMNVAAAVPDKQAPLDRQLLPLATTNFAAMVWADHAAIPAVNDTPRARLYTDSPRVVIISLVPGADGTLREEYDLRRDRLCGIAQDAASDRLVVDRKIWFAALEGALEHEAVAAGRARAGQDASAVWSTSNLLTADGVEVLKPGDLDRLPGMTSDVERAERMGDALRRGNILVVPKPALRSGPAGWWEIAPGGDARAVLGADLNMAGAYMGGGLPPLNSSFGVRLVATRQGVWVAREPVLKNPPRNPFARFGNRDPRPEKGRGGTEYTLVLAVMAIASITVLSYIGYQQYLFYQRMAEFDAAEAAFWKQHKR